MRARERWSHAEFGFKASSKLNLRKFNFRCVGSSGFDRFLESDSQTLVRFQTGSPLNKDY